MPAGFPVEPAVRFVAELALLGLASWYVFVHLGAARHLRRLGPIPVAAFWLLMVSWLSVQLVDRLHLYYPQESSYYPLTRFAMYEAGHPTEAVPAYYIEAEHAGGGTSRLDLAEWIPSVEPTALDNRFLVLIGWLDSDDREDIARAEREILGYLSGLRKILAESGEPVPAGFALHATTHRLRDGGLVADSVVWRTCGAEGER